MALPRAGSVFFGKNVWQAGLKLKINGEMISDFFVGFFFERDVKYFLVFVWSF